ncbi:MAG TPA: hypoxanthine phosphoribosyltransferase [Acidobacteriota bacterium]|nr:hypoxanthine phosphoribosyltransferase [Acidobacteriota bacterium]
MDDWTQDVGEVLLEEEVIRAKVKEIARRIEDDHQDGDILLVCVLRGAVIFFSDLIRALDLPVSVDFIAVSSYGASTKSSGQVRLIKDLEASIEGRHVILVEDIVDTGLTLSYLLRNLGNRNPSSLQVCSLLSKPSRRKVEVPVEYIGFEIEDQFVVGYGLDFDQRFRNLPYIGVYSPGSDH